MCLSPALTDGCELWPGVHHSPPTGLLPSTTNSATKCSPCGSQRGVRGHLAQRPSPGGDFVPWGTAGNVWRQVWCHSWGEWVPVGNAAKPLPKQPPDKEGPAPNANRAQAEKPWFKCTGIKQEPAYVWNSHLETFYWRVVGLQCCVRFGRKATRFYIYSFFFRFFFSNRLSQNTVQTSLC